MRLHSTDIRLRSAPLWETQAVGLTALSIPFPPLTRFHGVWGTKTFGDFSSVCEHFFFLILDFKVCPKSQFFLPLYCAGFSLFPLSLSWPSSPLE